MERPAGTVPGADLEAQGRDVLARHVPADLFRKPDLGGPPVHGRTVHGDVLGVVAVHDSGCDPANA